MPSRYSFVNWGIIYKMTFQWGKQAKGLRRDFCEAFQAAQIKTQLYFFKKQGFVLGCDRRCSQQQPACKAQCHGS